MESGTKFLIVTQLAVPLLRSVIHVPCLSTCLFFKLKRQKHCISTHNSFELGLIRLVCLHCLCTFQTPSFPPPPTPFPHHTLVCIMIDSHRYSSPSLTVFPIPVLSCFPFHSHPPHHLLKLLQSKPHPNTTISILTFFL